MNRDAQNFYVNRHGVRPPNIRTMAPRKPDGRKGGSRQPTADELAKKSGATPTVAVTVTQAPPADLGANPIRPTAAAFSQIPPSDIDSKQGGAADCYFLAPLMEAARIRPGFIQSLITDSATSATVKGFVRNGVAVTGIVDKTFPTGPYGGFGFVWPENSPTTWLQTLEKWYAFFRNCVVNGANVTSPNAYNTIGWGSAAAVWNDLNVPNVTMPTNNALFDAWLDAAFAAGEIVTTNSNPTVTIPNLVASHTHSIKARNPDGSYVLHSPWGIDGSGTSVDGKQDGDFTISAADYHANFGSATKTAFGKPDTGWTTSNSQSLPTTPAAETIMQLGTLINLALSSASTDSGIRLETRGGRPDFGFFPATEGGTIKFPVTVPTAGTYALMGAYSALGTVSMTASIGAESATYSLAPTGSWDVPQPWALTGIVLAAGAQTLTLTHHAGPQPDIFDCLTLVKTG